MTRLAPALLLIALPVAGCQGWQSALDAQGPTARSLADMFWIFAAVLTVVWVVTMTALVLSLRKRRPAGADRSIAVRVAPRGVLCGRLSGP